jgi:hypothetical protein
MNKQLKFTDDGNRNAELLNKASFNVTTLNLKTSGVSEGTGRNYAVYDDGAEVSILLLNGDMVKFAKAGIFTMVEKDISIVETIENIGCYKGKIFMG